MAINKKTLTAANCVLLFRCEGIYDSYVQLTGFQADNIFNLGDITLAQTVAGADGNLSGGFVFNAQTFGLNLEANSPSLAILENCAANFLKNKEIVAVDFQLTLPSIGKTASFSGFYTQHSGVSATKLLQGSQSVFEVDPTSLTEIA